MAVGLQVRVHPADDVTLLNVERVFVVVVFEDHLAQDAVDLHNAERAADLNAAILDLEVGVLGPLAGADLLDVALEGHGAFHLGRDPDLVTVEVAHDAHVGVVRQRVLRHQVNVLADMGREDHVRVDEATGVRAAKKDRASPHLRRIPGIRQRFFIGVQFLPDGFSSPQRVVPELPPEVVTQLFRAAEPADKVGVPRVVPQRAKWEQSRRDQSGHHRLHGARHLHNDV